MVYHEYHNVYHKCIHSHDPLWTLNKGCAALPGLCEWDGLTVQRWVTMKRFMARKPVWARKIHENTSDNLDKWVFQHQIVVSFSINIHTMIHLAAILAIGCTLPRTSQSNWCLRPGRQIQPYTSIYIHWLYIYTYVFTHFYTWYIYT